MHARPLHLCADCRTAVLPADKREKQYERDNTGTMYLFRMDSKQVIDATHRVSAYSGSSVWCVVECRLCMCVCARQVH